MECLQVEWLFYGVSAGWVVVLWSVCRLGGCSVECLQVEWLFYGVSAGWVVVLWSFRRLSDRWNGVDNGIIYPCIMYQLIMYHYAMYHSIMYYVSLHHVSLIIFLCIIVPLSRVSSYHLS